MEKTCSFFSENWKKRKEKVPGAGARRAINLNSQVLILLQYQLFFQLKKSQKIISQHGGLNSN